MERSLGTLGNLSIREADFARGAALIEDRLQLYRRTLRI
jgi:hypothetical protein